MKSTFRKESGLVKSIWAVMFCLSKAVISGKVQMGERVERCTGMQIEKLKDFLRANLLTGHPEL